MVFTPANLVKEDEPEEILESIPIVEQTPSPPNSSGDMFLGGVYPSTSGQDTPFIQPNLKRKFEDTEPLIIFYKTSQNAIIPRRGSDKAAGMDVYAVSGGVVSQFGVTKVNVDLRVVIPTGYYLRIADRSSMAAKGIHCIAGVIDEDYRGEIKVLFVNHSGSDYQFISGDAIAQLICEKICHPKIIQTHNNVLYAAPTKRGDGGFGSTNAHIQDIDAATPLEFRSTPSIPVGPAKWLRPPVTALFPYFGYSKIVWELRYWYMVEYIIANGDKKKDTSHGPSRTIFKPADFYIDLNDGQHFPMLHGRKISFKLIVQELLWFLSGSCDSKVLESENCNIWKGNTTSEYLEKRGLAHYKEGETGPMYGFLWRHFGADYRGNDISYENQGVDQIDQLIKRLRNNPNDRAHCVIAYDPTVKSRQCVTPCHVYCQFYVSHEGQQLNLAMTQRSVDVALGLPFNIASYSLLLIMVARVLGLRAGEYFHSCNDTHIYEDHIKSMGWYAHRFMRSSPTTYFTASVSVPTKESIDDYELKDFELTNYHPIAEGPVMKMNA